MIKMKGKKQQNARLRVIEHEFSSFKNTNGASPKKFMPSVETWIDTSPGVSWMGNEQEIVLLSM